MNQSTSERPARSGEVPWDEASALHAFWERSAYDRGFITNPFSGDAEARLGLRRTAALLDALGNPHHRYAIVHVAGSKGKGSTCAMLASILSAARVRAGLHISPQLHDFRERFVIDGQMIPSATFAALAQQTFALAAELEQTRPELGRLTAFELSTALAFTYFRDAGCTVAVVEVGMGGLLDATNVVDPAVSVITRLDWEHVAVLGPGMAEIAANKAGIIKPNRPAVSVAQEQIAESVILAAAQTAHAPLLLQTRDWTVAGSWRRFTASGPWGTISDLASALPGDHQIENAGAAIAALWAARDQLRVPHEDAIRAGLTKVRWPGRYERVTRVGRPEVILDGAHTPASAAALAATLRSDSPERPTALIVGMFADKDAAAFLEALRHVASDVAVVVAPVDSPRAADPNAVLAAAHRLGLKANAAPDLAAAFGLAEQRAGSNGRLVVTGSLTLVASARELLGLAAPSR